ncbi:hypothetical protein [Rhodococcus qingshengii]|uniref:hypothetical protein n=1 Tax=Rhodococcus qingshengii TaxID=334542 RepID=UPI002B000DC2|nr:hypothetical protein [Rhodococcus qingshengii]MEA1798536.1 hypothetical protein [Rhodococcus qingshengii]
MADPVLLAPHRAAVTEYRRDHPEARHWAYMTPRNWRTACRGVAASEVKVIAPMTITPDMLNALLPGLM